MCRFTYNQPENLNLLREFRQVLEQKTAEDEDNPRIMMTEAYLSNEDIVEYYGTNFTDHSGDISHMPINFGLVEATNNENLATPENVNYYA